MFFLKIGNLSKSQNSCASYGIVHHCNVRTCLSSAFFLFSYSSPFPNTMTSHFFAQLPLVRMANGKHHTESKATWSMEGREPEQPQLDNSDLYILRSHKCPRWRQVRVPITSFCLSFICAFVSFRFSFCPALCFLLFMLFLSLPGTPKSAKAKAEGKTENKEDISPNLQGRSDTGN